MPGKIQRCGIWSQPRPVALISLHPPLLPNLHMIISLKHGENLLQLVPCFFGWWWRRGKPSPWRRLPFFLLFAQICLALQAAALSPLPLCSPAKGFSTPHLPADKVNQTDFPTQSPPLSQPLLGQSPVDMLYECSCLFCSFLWPGWVMCPRVCVSSSLIHNTLRQITNTFGTILWNNSNS